MRQLHRGGSAAYSKQAPVGDSTAPGLARCSFLAGARGCANSTWVGALSPPTLAGASGCFSWTRVGALSIPSRRKRMPQLDLGGSAVSPQPLQAQVGDSTAPGWERCLFKAGARRCVNCTRVGVLSIPSRRKWMLQLDQGWRAGYQPFNNRLLIILPSC